MKFKWGIVIVVVLGLSLIAWFVLKPKTDLKSSHLNNGYVKWENELFYFELPDEFKCTRHRDNLYYYRFRPNHEHGFFSNGKAKFYFSYQNGGSNGPTTENCCVIKEEGVYGWKLIEDTIDHTYRKQFYNIDSSGADWHWSGVYLKDLDKDIEHDILFALSVFDENKNLDRSTKYEIEPDVLHHILKSVRLKGW